MKKKKTICEYFLLEKNSVSFGAMKDISSTTIMSYFYPSSSSLSCLLFMRHDAQRGKKGSYFRSPGPDHHTHSFSLILAFSISPHTTLSTDSVVSLDGSVGCAVRLETRRSWDQPPPRSATFFRGDWSWSIFYGHSLPSADSRRVVVSFWRKNVHNTG